MINNSMNRFLGVMCYPFVSVDLIEEDLFEQFFRTKDSKTKKDILLKVVKYIQENYGVYSYDEINMLLEKFFFYKKSYKNVYSCTYSILEKLATALLSKRDGKLVYKYWNNENDRNVLGGFAENNKILLLHSFNRHIPMDLMAMIYILENNTADIRQLHNFYGQITVADMQLDQQLGLGVAENHMHSGASMPFLSMWNLIMNPLTKKKEGEFKRLVWKDTLYIDGNRIWCLVLFAGILRVYIAMMLQCKESVVFHTEEESRLHTFIQYFLVDGSFKDWYVQLEQKGLKEVFAYVISLWDEISSYISIEDGIMRRLFQVPMYLKTSEENIFLFSTLLQLKESSKSNFKLKKLLLQYIRIKNTFFELLVQQKTIKGLDYFQTQFYSRNSKTVGMSSLNFWEMVIREQFQNRNLKKIEFRLSVTEKEADFQRNVKCFLESYLSIIETDYCIKDETGYYQVVKPFPRVGIVFSLLKRKDEKPEEKCYIDGLVTDVKIQFRVLQKQYLEQVEYIQRLRSSSSEMSKFIVGLDAASLENATPVWVFAPVYEYARDSLQDPLVVGNTLSYFQSLNFTFHAGEDFRHILSGIRRIDEAVTHLKFHAGDRIGHGIAMGLDVDNWYSENPVVILPRIELLENYLWAYDTLSKAEDDINSAILSYIEKHIYYWAKEIYDSTEGIKTEVLVDSYLNMFRNDNVFSCNEETVHKLFCQDIIEDRRVVWDADKLCIARNCKYYTEKMNEPIHIKVSEQDLDIAKRLQKIVKRKLSLMGIVVEINPSSNECISSMDSLDENQVFSMNSFLQENSNVLVCINSDDPSVFNTNVSNEFAYIFNALLRKGVSKENAMNWIEKLRQNGMNASFVRRNDTDQQVLDGLIQLVHEI